MPFLFLCSSFLHPLSHQHLPIYPTPSFTSIANFYTPSFSTSIIAYFLYLFIHSFICLSSTLIFYLSISLSHFLLFSSIRSQCNGRLFRPPVRPDHRWHISIQRPGALLGLYSEANYRPQAAQRLRLSPHTRSVDTGWCTPTFLSFLYFTSTPLIYFTFKSITNLPGPFLLSPTIMWHLIFSSSFLLTSPFPPFSLILLSHPSLYCTSSCTASIILPHYPTSSPPPFPSFRCIYCAS